MIKSISAVAAYQKALEANKRILTSFEKQNANLRTPLSILRVGDDLTQINRASKINDIESADQQHSFNTIFQKELLHDSIDKINDTSKVIFEVNKTDLSQEDSVAADPIKLLAALDEMHFAVNSMVVLRDRFIDAYKSIINMPI